MFFGFICKTNDINEHFRLLNKLNEDYCIKNFIDYNILTRKIIESFNNDFDKRKRKKEVDKEKNNKIIETSKKDLKEELTNKKELNISNNKVSNFTQNRGNFSGNQLVNLDLNTNILSNQFQSGVLNFSRNISNSYQINGSPTYSFQ